MFIYLSKISVSYNTLIKEYFFLFFYFFLILKINKKIKMKCQCIVLAGIGSGKKSSSYIHIIMNHIRNLRFSVNSIKLYFSSSTSSSVFHIHINLIIEKKILNNILNSFRLFCFVFWNLCILC